MEHKEAIRKLRAKQGKQSLRSFARSLGISAPYLSDIYKGKRSGAPLLDRLGIKKARMA